MAECRVVFLLVRLPGAGKATFTQQRLDPMGAVRLSMDEIVHARQGRYGVDYPERTYVEKEAPVVAELRGRLRELLAEGRDVVWDHDRWRRRDRDSMKDMVQDGGARWRLPHFRASREELLRRLAERNRRGDANALFVTPEALDDFVARFEEPVGEGEEVVESDWF